MFIANPLNESSFAYPVLVGFHVLGIVAGVGTAALMDLRLLGVGMTGGNPSSLWRDTFRVTLGGLGLAIFSGLLLFSIDPELYYNNQAFRLKMLALVLAVGFYYTMVRRSAARDHRAAVVASVSLGLFALVPLGGISIGFGALSPVAYPILLWLHIAALIAWGGMMLTTDLRLLGFGATNEPVPRVFEGLRWPKRISFAIAALCGAVLFGAKAGQYSYNPNFWIKMTLLALLAANYLILRREARPAGRLKLAGGLSILLWAGAIWAARGPATVKDIMHSMIDPSADFLFQSVQIVGDENGTREIAPETDDEWQDVRSRLAVLQQLPDLFGAPAIRAARPRDRSLNPEIENEPAEVQGLLTADRADFIRRAQKLRDAASVAMQAVDAKDKAGLMRGLDGIDKACEVCHLKYWYPRDQRAQQAARESGILE
jgi:hypothetical protein